MNWRRASLFALILIPLIVVLVMLFGIFSMGDR